MSEKGPKPNSTKPPAPDIGPEKIQLKERILSIVRKNKNANRPEPDVSSKKILPDFLHDTISTVVSTMFWIGVIGTGVSAVDWLSNGKFKTEVKRILNEIEKESQKGLTNSTKPEISNTKNDTPPIKESVSTPDVTIKDEVMLTALANIETSFGETAEDKKIAFLETPATANNFCTFNDLWVRANKKELGYLYSYIDKKVASDHSLEEILDSKLFPTLVSLKKKMSEGFLTSFAASKIPTNDKELDTRVANFLNGPKKETSSCGFTFNAGFSLMGKDSAQQIQNLGIEFIKIFAITISKDLKSNDEKLKEEARLHYPILITLIEKARQIKARKNR